MVFACFSQARHGAPGDSLAFPGEFTGNVLVSAKGGGEEGLGWFVENTQGGHDGGGVKLHLGGPPPSPQTNVSYILPRSLSSWVPKGVVMVRVTRF